MSVLARIAAFLVAIGLVVGAVVLRDAREGDLSAPSIGDGDGEPVVAACVVELEQLCLVAFGAADVEWEVAGAGVHAQALEGGEPMAVVLPASWADVADDARGRAGQPALARSDVLARTPLLVVGFADRMQVLAEACGVAGSEVGWACIGDHAGTRWEDLGGDVRWGSVVPGHGSPDTATGLLATAGVVAAHTGTPFSLADLRDVTFTSWFGQVERAVADFTPPGGSHLTAMVTRGPSVANVAAATEAEVVSRGLDTAFGPIVVAVPEPLYEVELVVAGTDPALVERLAGQVDTGALADAGWRTDGAAPAGTPLVELPAPTTRPNGGVLTAVRDAWRDIAG